MSRSDIRGIGQAALSISSLTLLVKILGMGREMLMARNLGVAPEVDAFVVAFGLVTLYINVFLGTVPAALVPLFVRLRTKEGERSAVQLGGWVTVRGLGVSLAAVLVLDVAARPLLALASPGLGPSAKIWLVPVFRAISPLILFSTLSSFLGAILNAEGGFAVPALVPGLTAVASVGALFFLPGLRIWALVMGLLVGGALEASVLAWAVFRRGRLTLGPVPWEHLRGFLHQFYPMVGGGLLMCSTAMVDVGVASFLPPGGIAALSYANRIPQAFLSLSSGALGTAILPFYSRLVARKDWQGLRRVAGTYLAGSMALSAVLTLLLVLGSRNLVALTFQHGAFGAAQTVLVGHIQSMYFLQIPFYIGGILVVRMISSLGHNEILLPAAAFSAAMNLGLDLLLLPRMGLPGIALSTALVHLTTLALLSMWSLRLLRRAERVP